MSLTKFSKVFLLLENITCLHMHMCFVCACVLACMCLVCVWLRVRLYLVCVRARAYVRD